MQGTLLARDGRPAAGEVRTMKDGWHAVYSHEFCCLWQNFQQQQVSFSRETVVGMDGLILSSRGVSLDLVSR